MTRPGHIEPLSFKCVCLCSCSQIYMRRLTPSLPSACSKINNNCNRKCVARTTMLKRQRCYFKIPQAATYYKSVRQSSVLAGELHTQQHFIKHQRALHTRAQKYSQAIFTSMRLSIVCSAIAFLVCLYVYGIVSAIAASVK